MGWQRVLAGITASVAATAGLAGCAQKKPADTAAPTSSAAGSTSASGQASPPASAPASNPPSPTETQALRTENWTALKPGDCLAEAPPTDPAVVTVTVVDCTQPHLAETFLRAPIPVDAALDTTANTQCEAGFTQYTGRGSAGSPYVIGYLIDSDQDRTGNIPLPSTVICLLQGAQGQSLTGSAKA